MSDIKRGGDRTIFFRVFRSKIVSAAVRLITIAARKTLVIRNPRLTTILNHFSNPKYLDSLTNCRNIKG